MFAGPNRQLSTNIVNVTLLRYEENNIYTYIRWKILMKIVNFLSGKMYNQKVVRSYTIVGCLCVYICIKNELAYLSFYIYSQIDG